MDESGGYIISLFLGLFTIARFKQISEFHFKKDLLLGLFAIFGIKQSDDSSLKKYTRKPVPAKDKWALHIVQTIILIVGILFVVLALINLYPLFV